MKKALIIITMFSLLMIYAGESFATSKWQPREGEKWIKINKEQLRLTLYKGQDPLKTWQIAIGKGRGTEKNPVSTLLRLRGHSQYTGWSRMPRSLSTTPPGSMNRKNPKQASTDQKLISFYNNWQIAIHGTNNPSDRQVDDARVHKAEKRRHRRSGKDNTKMKLVIVERDENRKFYKETI